MSMNPVPNQNQDAELLAQLKSGDSKAVRRWFSLYQGQLLKLVLTKVSSKSDAEELVQETFLSCLKHLPLFQGRSSIWTWMQRIARHEIADYYRKKYAKKALQTIPWADWLLSKPADDAHETARKVSQALAQLSQEYRELLMLKYVDNLAVKEIAAKLNRSVKAIESDLFRARQAFKLAYVALE